MTKNWLTCRHQWLGALSSCKIQFLFFHSSGLSVSYLPINALKLPHRIPCWLSDILVRIFYNNSTTVKGNNQHHVWGAHACFLQTWRMLTTRFYALIVGTYNPPWWPAEAMPMVHKVFKFYFFTVKQSADCKYSLDRLCLQNVQIMQYGKRRGKFLKNAVKCSITRSFKLNTVRKQFQKFDLFLTNLEEFKTGNGGSVNHQQCPLLLVPDRF